MKRTKTDQEQHDKEAPVIGQSTVFSWQYVLLKATGLSLLIFLGMALLTLIGISVYGYSKYRSFLKAVNLTHAEVSAFVKQGWESSPKQSNGSTNFLILGLDSVPNKTEAPALTDTLMLASVNYSIGTIHLLSLPRDLWNHEYQTKINALYYYGSERTPLTPEQFPAEVISQMTGVPIHHTIVFSLDSVAELVESLDGIEITVPVSFTDTEFPRSDVDVTITKDPKLLYETVTFQAGTQRMDGATVLKYIRSRHSSGETGTDDDRSKRQQLVAESLLATLKQPALLKNPDQVAVLYAWYKRYVQKVLPEPELMSIGKALYPVRNSVQLKTATLSIFPADPNGVIFHPPLKDTQNQWSYDIKNQEQFKKEVKSKLQL